MQYRTLGNTGLQVSVICQGCWSIVTDDFTWGPQQRDDSVAALRAAHEAGINFFDTAEGYGQGESEQLLAEALGTVRREAIIATKVSPSHLRAGQVRESCIASLRRLGSDYIDLYQVHWPSGEVPLAETIGAMRELRSEGLIRAWGVSNFGVSYLNDALAIEPPASNQLPYSLLFRPIERRVLPLCRRHDVGVLTYSSLFQGLLTGKFTSADDVPETRARTRIFSSSRPHTRHGQAGCEAQAFQAIERIRQISSRLGEPMGRVSLAWLAARPGVASVIAGGRSAAQARENARAAELQLSAQTIAELDAATEAVAECLGDNCDMWQAESRMERPDQ